MRITGVSFAQPFAARDALKGVIYARPVKTDSTQKGIIDEALDELEDVEFDKTDIMYMRSLGINPAFNSGEEIVDYLEDNDIPIQYGKFSDKDVHACLARGEEEGTKTVLINERYKDASSKPEILATAEAISHEAGHAKDDDTSNSIQEELDNLEIKVSYLELKFDELNQVIIEQDRAISKMKAQIEALEKKVVDLEEESGQDRPNRRPPHY